MKAKKYLCIFSFIKKLFIYLLKRITDNFDNFNLMIMIKIKWEMNQVAWGNSNKRWSLNEVINNETLS